jgi:hypothetical protein
MPRVCVPHVCRSTVLHTAHGDSVLVGHPGMESTAASVVRSYWWSGLHRDVAHFVRSCRTYAAVKRSITLRLDVESHSAVPVEPFSNWAMDLIGPVSLSQVGNDLILTWVDKTSKMIAASPLSSKASSSRDLAALTWRHICCRFGLPLVLTHDNDVRFGSLWKELCQLVGTKNDDPRYEVDKILCHRTFKGRREMLVRWAGYDESHNQWVRRSVLEEDVPTLVLAYDANPSIFVSRKSAPKRATKGSPDMVSPAVRRSSRFT